MKCEKLLDDIVAALHMIFAAICGVGAMLAGILIAK